MNEEAKYDGHCVHAEVCVLILYKFYVSLGKLMKYSDVQSGPTRTTSSGKGNLTSPM